MLSRALPFLALALALGLTVALPAAAQRAPACENTGDFGEWLAAFRQDAVRQGIRPRTLEAALGGVTFDPKVIVADRNQRAFRMSFEEFSASRIPPRLKRARSLMQRNAQLLSRIEARFGVPGAVVVAIWGLETDFGANTGKMSTLRSLATLAYDCRRTEMFRAELIHALELVQGGDLTPGQMRGAWAGELGQTQFMPSSYVKFAVDFDGDGKRNLIGSTADVLASTANYLKGYGWRAGQPWDEGTANFDVIRQWNRSPVVAKTIAAFADQLSR